MSAPTYRDRVDGTIVQAIQFIKDDPRTHWHVNLGHPVAKALQDKFWVLTVDNGPVEINDRDFVISSDGALRVLSEADFQARFEPVVVVESRDGTKRALYTLQPGETWTRLDDNLIVAHPERAPIMIMPDGTTQVIELKSPMMVEGDAAT